METLREVSTATWSWRTRMILGAEEYETLNAFYDFVHAPFFDAK